MEGGQHKKKNNAERKRRRRRSESPPPALKDYAGVTTRLTDADKSKKKYSGYDHLQECGIYINPRMNKKIALRKIWEEEYAPEIWKCIDMLDDRGARVKYSEIMKLLDRNIAKLSAMIHGGMRDDPEHEDLREQRRLVRDERGVTPGFHVAYATVSQALDEFSKMWAEDNCYNNGRGGRGGGGGDDDMNSLWSFHLLMTERSFRI